MAFGLINLRRLPGSNLPALSALALFVFVQIADDQFVRKPVPLDQATADGYVTTTGFAAGDRIVVQGAQMLLTEEFKSRLTEER